MGHEILFDGWPKLGRGVILAILAYGTLVILLRISGKRTLTKMNVFDFVFVVALGSSLSMTILSPQVTLADGVAVLATLIGVQVLLSWLCTQSPWLEATINGEPTLLVYRGQFLRDTMKRERITDDEIFAAVRNEGLTAVGEAESVVLETDGTLSVVWRKVQGAESSLHNVPGHPGAVANARPATA